MSKEFPQMLHRADGAKVVNRIVADADELAAAVKDGWGDVVKARAEAARGAPKQSAAPVGNGAHAKLAQQNIDLANEVVSKDAIITAKDNVIQAQGDRIVALEAFLGTVASDENCPDDLKTAIGELLSGEAGEEVEAPAAKRAARGKK